MLTPETPDAELRAFLTERTEIAPGFILSHERLFQAYRAWHEAQPERRTPRPMASDLFTRLLKQRGLKRAKFAHRPVGLAWNWMGLDFKPGWAPEVKTAQRISADICEHGTVRLHLYDGLRRVFAVAPMDQATALALADDIRATVASGGRETCAGSA
jgi:hypothetical protein